MADDTRAWFEKHLLSLVGPCPHCITDDATLEQLGADSLDAVEIAMAAEDRFHIRIADDEIAASHTVGAFVRLIDVKVAAR